MRAKESWNINFILLTEQFLELVSVFKQASRNLTFIFLLNKTGLKFRQKIIAYQKFYRPSKNAHLVTQSLENRKHKDDLSFTPLRFSLNETQHPICRYRTTPHPPWRNENIEKLRHIGACSFIQELIPQFHTDFWVVWEGGYAAFTHCQKLTICILNVKNLMRSSRVVRASDCQCRSPNSPETVFLHY